MQKIQWRGYQSKGVEHILNNKRCAIWIDPGLGKTVMVLTALVELLSINPELRVLIVAPKAVAVSVWEHEASRWEHLSALPKMVNLAKVPMAKAELGHINIINYDKLVKLFTATTRFDVVVYDEVTRLKSPMSKVSRAAGLASKDFGRIVALTGTPIGNSTQDLFGQFRALGSQALGKSVTQFRYRYMRQKKSRFAYCEWVSTPHGTAKAKSDCADLVYSPQTRMECPVAETFRYVTFSQGLRTKYDKLASELDYKFSDGNYLAIDNSDVVVNKCLQFCDGFLYRENDKAENVHKLKLEALDELIEEERSIIWTTFIESRDFVLKMPDMTDSIEVFRAGDAKHLVASPFSLGHGVDGLQRICSRMVWYARPWSSEVYRQALGRLIRTGQERTVSVSHIMTDGTIEGVQYKRLRYFIDSSESMLATG